MYPCSLEDVKRTLKALPCDDRYIERIKAVKFRSGRRRSSCYRRTWWMAAHYWTGTITIFGWPEGGWYWCKRTMPKKLLRQEAFFKYGGAVSKIVDGWWFGWSDRQELSRYFTEWLLPHEVGHLLRDSGRWSHKKAERMANGFLGQIERRRRKLAGR